MPNTGFDNGSAGQTLVNNALSNVAGILSTRPNAKYLSGARVTLKINGKLVGFAFGISWNITTDFIEINTCDDYLPYELAPRRVTKDGNRTFYLSYFSRTFLLKLAIQPPTKSSLLQIKR